MSNKHLHVRGSTNYSYFDPYPHPYAHAYANPYPHPNADTDVVPCRDYSRTSSGCGSIRHELYDDPSRADDGW